VLFNFFGVGSFVPVDGMMNSDKYMDVIQRKVIPHMREIFPEVGGIFQQDLAPCYASKKVKKFLQILNSTT